MRAAEHAPSMAVLLFGGARLPRCLHGLPVHRDDLAAVIGRYRRIVVVGADADLATVVTQLLRAERLDVEVGYAPPRRTAATRVYRLPTGRRAARRARRGTARRVPLIRDETGTAIVGGASWLSADEGGLLHGEAIVDDTTLFNGDTANVRIEPTLALPGLRASAKRRRWIAGRATQLGTTGALVMRDGVAAPRQVRRSTFYRNVEGWQLVR